MASCTVDLTIVYHPLRHETHVTALFEKPRIAPEDCEERRCSDLLLEDRMVWREYKFGLWESEKEVLIVGN